MSITSNNASSPLINKYFALWGTVLPITSVLLFPSVQGTTFGYFFALLAIPFVLVVSKRYGALYLRSLLCVFAIFALLTVIGQLVISIAGLNGLAGLDLVRHEDTSILLRSTLFTQSLYLLAVVSTFFFVKYFYHPKWIPYILAGAVLLGLYGIYELGFYLVTGRPGDILTNRTFREDAAVGSLFQTFSMGAFTMQRLKSLTGEPSMYALTILPYWVFALKTGYKKISYFLLLTLVLSTSTTAFLGFVVYILSNAYYKRSLKPMIAAVASISVIAAAGWSFVKVWLQIMLIDKLALENGSGLQRFSSFSSNMNYWWNSSSLIKMFGIGFGTVRSADLFSTLLVNNGVLGLILVSCVFLYPLFSLKNTPFEIGLKQICLICFSVLMISVPEFAYLSTWLFLGIAYHRGWSGGQSSSRDVAPVRFAEIASRRG